MLTALSLFITASSHLKAEEISAAPTPYPAPSIAPGTDPATATRAWLDSVPADKRAKSDAYFEGGYWLILWNYLLSAAVMLFVLNSRISARLRDFAERTTRFKAMQIVLYTIPFFVITALLQFPLFVYENFFREHKYDLATQTFGPWLIDQLKAFGFTLIGFPIFLIVLYAVLRRAPRLWPVLAATVVFVFQLIVIMIFPVVVEPAFNKYTPVEDPTIRDPIIALARANQIPTDKVFEVDASAQTTRISANVSGLLGTTRIALNDNLLKQCTISEIRQVMGHEMGHYVLNHGMKLSLYFGLVFLIGFALIQWALNAALRCRGEKWGIRGVADPAGLPLLALLLSTYLFLMTPIINSAIRVTEAEADIFGLNTAREPDGFAKAALKLGAYRKLDPTPLEEFLFFDHPSGRARIRMSMDWKSAHLPAGGDATP